jgi:hypothetical protein
MLAPTVLFHELNRYGLIRTSRWKVLDWLVCLGASILYLGHDHKSIRTSALRQVKYNCLTFKDLLDVGFTA